MPVLLVLSDRLGYDAAQNLVEGLGQAIRLWVPGSGVLPLDLKLLDESVDALVPEVWSIIRLNPRRDPEPVYDIVTEKSSSGFSRDFSQRDRLRPLGEIVCGSQDVLIAVGCCFKWSDDVCTPFCERPRGNCRM